MKFSSESYAIDLLNKKQENNKLLKQLIREKELLVSKMVNVENNNFTKKDENNNGKEFNQLGIHHYQLGNFKESEKYLLKGYNILLDDDKNIIVYNLGVLYGSKNTLLGHQKAIEYFKKSNLKEGYFNLGLYYYMGLGVKENNQIAYEYFLKSSNLGFERAQKNFFKMEKLYPSLKK